VKFLSSELTFLEDLLENERTTSFLKRISLEELKKIEEGEDIREEIRELLSQEILEINYKARNVKYETRDGELKNCNLLEVIENTFPFIHELYDEFDVTWVIHALASFLIYKKASEAFIWLYKDGEKINYIPLYEGNKLKLPRPKFDVRAGGQILRVHGLAEYDLNLPGWVPKKFKSKEEFHDTIFNLIKDYRIERDKTDKPSLLTWMAEEVLWEYDQVFKSISRTS